MQEREAKFTDPIVIISIIGTLAWIILVCLAHPIIKNEEKRKVFFDSGVYISYKYTVTKNGEQGNWQIKNTNDHIVKVAKNDSSQKKINDRNITLKPQESRVIENIKDEDCFLINNEEKALRGKIVIEF